MEELPIGLHCKAEVILWLTQRIQNNFDVDINVDIYIDTELEFQGELIGPSFSCFV